MGVQEMQRIAELFNLVYENKDDEEKLKEIKEEVKEMCLKFPVPGINR